jgi:hypothetical protein
MTDHDLYVASRVKWRAQNLRPTLSGCLFHSVEIGGVDRPRAGVRLAHQLISGSSMTACHDPACTAQTIEETGSHFLPAIGSPIEASNTRRPASGFQTNPEAQ